MAFFAILEPRWYDNIVLLPRIVTLCNSKISHSRGVCNCCFLRKGCGSVLLSFSGYLLWQHTSPCHSESPVKGLSCLCTFTRISPRQFGLVLAQVLRGPFWLCLRCLSRQICLMEDWCYMQIILCVKWKRRMIRRLNLVCFILIISRSGTSRVVSLTKYLFLFTQ